MTKNCYHAFSEQSSDNSEQDKQGDNLICQKCGYGKRRPWKQRGKLRPVECRRKTRYWNKQQLQPYQGELCRIHI